MARKDIYKIDNYFIAIGYTLFFLGALSTLFDPHMWHEIVIKEAVDGKTRLTFEDKNGRTLETIQIEKGERFVVAEIQREFPTVRAIMAVNGLVLLLIGYGYRSREKKIISVWHALEHTGEAAVSGLAVSLGLTREFILKHLKDINAQQHSAYTYDSRSDKIINTRLASEYLVFVDCSNCGRKINQKVSLDLSSPPQCEYCGTGVSAEHLNQLKQDALTSMRSATASTGVAASGGGEFNIVLFVVLLLLFWPAAVFYVIKKKTSL